MRDYIKARLLSAGTDLPHIDTQGISGDHAEELAAYLVSGNDIQTRREQLGYLADECMARGLLMEPNQDGTISLYEWQGGSGNLVDLVAGPATAEELVAKLQTKAEPAFEWRAVAEISSIQGADYQSEWEPWDGPETDPDDIQEIVSRMGTSLGYEAASDAAGFSYGIQVRKIGEES